MQGICVLYFLYINVDSNPAQAGSKKLKFDSSQAARIHGYSYASAAAKMCNLSIKRASRLEAEGHFSPDEMNIIDRTH
jgi:hypothetical protein